MFKNKNIYNANIINLKLIYYCNYNSYKVDRSLSCRMATLVKKGLNYTFIEHNFAIYILNCIEFCSFCLFCLFVFFLSHLYSPV